MADKKKTKEPAMMGDLPAKKKIAPPAMLSGEPAPPFSEAISDDDAAHDEHEVPASSIGRDSAELAGAAQELSLATNELHDVMRALGDLLTAMPK